MSDSKLNVAVVGLGMGKAHLRGYAANPRAEIVAVVDVNPERLKAVQEEYPQVRIFTDHKEMLKEIQPDLVSVVLPNFLHEPVSVDCLEAGADVLCDKPLAHSLESALRIEQAVARTGNQLYMNLSQRFSGPHLQAKAMVDAGALGEVYQGYTEWTRRDGMPGFGGWFGQKDKSGGGPLIDLGVHRIDLALWLMGSPKPVTVSGSLHHRRGMPLAKKTGQHFDVEDFASGFIRFENGATLLTEISWAGYMQHKDKLSMRLIGSEGGLEFDSQSGGLVFSGEQAGVPVVTKPIPPAKQAPYSTCVLVDALLDEQPFAANLADGLRMQVILEALYRSAELGRELDLRSEFPDVLDKL